MLRKFSISALLFPILLALTVPAGSQTRPRRVEPPANDAPALTAEAQTTERPRVIRERPTEIREGAPPRQNPWPGIQNRWPGILLGTAIAIGASRIGHGGVRGTGPAAAGTVSSCSPTRGVVIGGPRFLPLGADR